MPPEPRIDDKRRLILNAARELLARRGPQAIVLDQVAREACVAKGTLYLYFKSKEDLFAAVFEDLVAELGLALDELLGRGLSGPALAEALSALILSHFDRHRDFIFPSSVGQVPSCGPKMSARVLEGFSRNCARVETALGAIKPGIPARADRAFAAAALFGLCRTALFQKILSGSPRPLAERAPTVARFFLRGLGGLS